MLVNVLYRGSWKLEMEVGDGDGKPRSAASFGADAISFLEECSVFHLNIRRLCPKTDKIRHLCKTRRSHFDVSPSLGWTDSSKMLKLSLTIML